MFAPDPRPHSPVGNGGKSEWVHLSSQYLIAPAILRTTDRGAKRVLTAVTLFIQPATTTARFESSPFRPV
jgi:hypothetical protein